MPHLLQIDASSQPDISHSKMLADVYQQQWLKHVSGDLTQHSLIDMNLPHVNNDFIGAMFTPTEERTAEQQQTLNVSDDLVFELKQTSTLLISTPMYNFSIPSQLKAYFDHVIRAGETFRYGENGPEGLLNIEEVIVVVSSGGDYTAPPMDNMNHVKPYLSTLLGFIGLTNVTWIEAPNMSRSGELQEQSLQDAKDSIHALFSNA